ncbi:MAG: outer membrane lipoprotein-sorting protein [Candidatus Bipolaricaulota bacterium]|nr:outer membrane lipoprotein-sorting protein [Candidatus Bipolaricaulota bacterium]
MKRVVVVMAVGFLAVAGWAQTASEILARVEKASLFGTGTGSLYVSLAVRIEEAGQPGAFYAFRVWAKEFPDGTTKTLLLYAAPELVAGTLYLAHTPKAGPGRIWLWLPDLEILKELVGEGERKGEFIAGSGITYDDVASGFSYREGYTPAIVGEEALLGARAWKLELLPAKAGQDWSRILLWVHKEAYLVLRAEFFDRGGKLARVLSVPELVRDAVGLRPARLVVEDRLKGGRATVEITERSAADIPDSYFEPGNLGKLKL